MIDMLPRRSASSPAGPDPRLKLALDLARERRNLQNETLTALRARSLSLLEVVILGAAIVFGFGASDRGELKPWMVILLLIGVAYCLTATCLILLPTGWKAPDWTIAHTKPDWCGVPNWTVDQCIEQLIEDAKGGVAKNNRVIAWKRDCFVSMFVVLAILITLAVIFWVTLGTT